MKILVVLFCCLSSALVGIAQKTELRFGTGYHFSTSSQHFTDNVVSSYNSLSYKKVDASLGRGLSVYAGMNFSVKSWLAVAGDVYYNQTLPKIQGSYVFNAVDYYYSEQNKWRSQLLTVVPSLVLKVPGQRINPYSKFGVVVPVYSRVKVTGETARSGLGTPSGSGENIRIFRLRNTVGYCAAIGIAPQSKSKTSFFAEINLVSQSIKTRKATLTSDKINGVEKIDTYTVYSKETIYVNSLDNQNYDSGKPARALSFSLPYSSIGLNVGLNIKL